MDRYWLITWTCYGTWLPGDRRGFVGRVRDDHGDVVIHNTPGTPYDANMPALEAEVRAQMKGPPVSLDEQDAAVLLAQYQETVQIRGWELEAASVMYNHTHMVVGVRGDPDPGKLLELFKSWATRALKKYRALPPNGTFWTAKGSTRKLPDDVAVKDAVIYVVQQQPNPLAVWHAPRWLDVLTEHGRAQGLGKPIGVHNSA